MKWADNEQALFEQFDWKKEAKLAGKIGIEESSKNLGILSLWKQLSKLNQILKHRISTESTFTFIFWSHKCNFNLRMDGVSI